MDIVQIFNDELQSLVDIKPPVSKAKMVQITRAAMKGVKFYKHIVLTVEKFVARCSPEYKVPGLYVIDSIVRQSRHQFGIDRDVYAARFARNLGITFENLFSDCTQDDKQKIVRVLNLWQKNGVFNSHVIQPLLNMASPSAALQTGPKSPNSSDNNNSLRQKYNSHSYNESGSSAIRHPRASDGGLKFSKNMLDFDYDEDDDDDGDETPTEAEPPLSSTLNKIEMEQRGKRLDKSSNNNNNNNNNVSSYQSSQKSTNPDQVHVKKQLNQDPVLERWNRIIRQQIDPSDCSNTPSQHSISDTRAKRRSRSRTPPLAQPQTSYSSNQSASATRTSSSYTAHKELNQQAKDSDSKKTTTTTTTTATSIEKSPTRDAERIKERERHVPKTVSEADISDAFGEYGTINSIDLIPPRGCAYVCMDRRQDAKRALNESRDLKLNGSHIKMAWAPGKGFKEYKKLKDFWEADVGASFIPYSKVDESIDFDTLEEGGVIDEDSMSLEMRDRREKKANGDAKESSHDANLLPQAPTTGLNIPPPGLPMLSQPPPPSSIQSFSIPPPNLSIPPPVALGQGLIPFPPPGVVTSISSANQMLAPHPAHLPPVIVSSQSSTTHDNQKDFDKPDGSSNSPLSIDQQLSMTERQISMVEQQLNMIQQSQGMGQEAQVLPLMQAMPPQALFYQQNQPNPMMFDLPPPQLLQHGNQPMLDPQHMAMFMNHPLNMMGGRHPLIPMSQASMMDPNDMNGMAQHHGGF